MNNSKSYNLIADEWDKNRRERGLDPIIIKFEKLLADNSIILDIGCGTGYPIDYYLDKCNHIVIGIDPAEKMIEKAKALGLSKASFYQDDLVNYKSDTLFDAVIAFDSLFHVEFQEQTKIYERVSNMLKKGGLFIFTHGLKNGSVVGQMFGQEFHYFALDKDALIKCLNEAGFEIVWFLQDYKERITGERDVLVLADKI